MPKWDLFDLRDAWKGEDAFIIGGGPSLKGFDFSLLEGKRTIGCNSAYLLGPHICQLLCFGDAHWWDVFKQGVIDYWQRGGQVFTTARKLEDHPAFFQCKRIPHGLGTDALGWNGNTGAIALNLALILGATRVFLLGFDMKLGAGAIPNWHPNPIIDKPNPEVYNRFLRGFSKIKADWMSLYPERRIVNLNPESALDEFPKMTWNQAFLEKEISGAFGSMRD